MTYHGICEMCYINDISTSHFNSNPLVILLQQVCRNCYNEQNRLHDEIGS